MTRPARRTSPRVLVRHELTTSDHFRTVNEIHLALARQRDRASLSTVYRTLTTLAAAGVVETVHLPGAGSAYRLRPEGATGPYLVCVRCGSAALAPTDDLLPWFHVVGAHEGFGDIEARIELWGRCPSCRSSVNDNHSQLW